MNDLAENLEKIQLWYSENKPIYELLSAKVKGIISDNLESKNIDYHFIQSRAKSLKSFTMKYDKLKPPKKPEDVRDLAGIRIIGYVLSDVDEIIKVVTKLSDSKEQKVEDKTEILVGLV